MHALPIEPSGVKRKMVKEFSIAVFEGDGIGPEIMKPTIDILDHMAKKSNSYGFSFINAPAGAAHYAKCGESLPKESMQAARDADAILLSAMGLPSVRYEDGTEISPQIDLRKELNLFAGVRPVRIVAGQDTPLNLPAGKEVDFVLIRESTEGLFYSQGKGTRNEFEATETLKITKKTSEDLFDFAFSLANQRKEIGMGAGEVTCVDKANVFRAFAFFRDIFDKRAQLAPEVNANHAYVDATALWMVTRPWTFDVLVTENMFGDILSDLGAGIMGGLGLAPSADIGHDHAVFQPCHGSAPDIAGQNMANPLAMILSAAMMLEWLGLRVECGKMVEDAQALRHAVDLVVVEKSNLTRDLGGQATTTEAAQAVLERI